MKVSNFPKIVLAVVASVGCLVGQIPNTVSFPEVFEGAIAEASARQMQSFKARVVRVADGDTVTVVKYGEADCGKKCRSKIRLLGIDAPEMKMPYGEQSKIALERLIKEANGIVTVSYRKEDRYKRIVGKLEANGKDLNLEMIRQGMAWYFAKYRKDVAPGDQAKYEKAQNTARASRLGLWKASDPMPPWEWRRLNK